LPDLRQEHGRWFADIRHDELTGQATKSGKARMVPLHKELELAGFISFLEARLSSQQPNDSRLFPQLEKNARGHIGAKPSRWWRGYLAKIGIKGGADGKGAHSFRHTLSDELRAAGFLDDQFGPLILGHRRASVTAGYGRLPQGTADMLCAMIDGVQFKGVNFAGLHRPLQKPNLL
jgi:integrase